MNNKKKTLKCRYLLSNLKNLDETRVGVWGWGYGGYVTAMILGSNKKIFKCGTAVSPITDWLFYSEYIDMTSMT
jgi:inactive dipeptidyl peptidase 10